MTEYEMADLLNELINSVRGYLDFYMALLSAFLIVGFFLGPKMTRLMNAILIVLFSMLYAVMFVGVAALLSRQGRLRLEIINSAEELSWLHETLVTTSAFSFAQYFLPGSIVAAYFGAVIFFIQACRRNVA